ncbi:unnamed protein product [Blepharisma stoltei]|uniref:Uncharacterized protein n=1 Tax=Blepharisma stoltei TaxID=1481888 RepID=A0AAU9IZB8_9CILI|nr:unnamed protein product [Blepharisma stoltei]
MLNLSSHNRVWAWLCLLILFVTSSSFDVLIVFSNRTKAIMQNFITSTELFNKNSTEIFYCNDSYFDEEISNHPNLIAVFDITNNLNSQFEIAKVCEFNLLAHFLVSDSLPYQSKWTFLLSSSKEDLSKAIVSTLTYFNWIDGVAISDVERYASLCTMASGYSSNINLYSVGSNTVFHDLIGREIMKLGSSLFYLYLDKELSLELQKNLVSSKLIINGTGILLIEDGSYGSSTEGALAIVDKGKELTDSKENYLIDIISEMIDTLSNISSSYNIQKVLEERCINRHCVTEFSLINIQEAKRKIVGSIKNGKLSLNFPIIFPGSSTNIPISQKKVLFFSASNGSTDPGGNPVALVPINTRGIALAVKHMNTGTEILQNFQIKLSGFDCGVNIYNPDFCLSCFGKDINKLGLAHIGGLSSSMAMGDMITFKKLNRTTPLVSATNTEVSLGNSTKYPYYSRVNLNNYDLAAQIPLFLKTIGEGI